MWIDTVETSRRHRHEIKEHFYNAPKEVRDVHPFEILDDGTVMDLWRWVIYSANKPEDSAMSDTLDHGDVVHHFTARAEIYDRSSHGASEDLMEKVVACAPGLTITSWTWPAEPAS